MTAPAGTGPGHITADGCAVDLYVELRAGREPDLISSAVPARSSILELGAGAGRITRELTARGHPVVAVDESAEMLAHIGGAEKVAGSIEGLDLGRRFGVVLLCSHLINSGDPAQREEFVAVCARHVEPTGCVIIERHPPDWFDTAAESTVSHDGIEVRLREVSRPASGLLSATVDYRVGARTWSQSFTAARLDDIELSDLLGRHGLVVDRVMDDASSWIRAVLRPPVR